jgi:hypothetical protein
MGENEKESGLQIKKCLKMVDRIIENKTSIDDFRQNLELLLS